MTEKLDKLQTNITLLRADIQALRGFAVLVVVFYHAKFNLLPAGYLGVDVFFVISGFLITGFIKKRIENGSFSLYDFYFRRARRLIPAAYVTFFVTIIASQFILTTSELKNVIFQVIGALTFSENFILWKQAGYFGGAAELKPFLHIWSLAIEEQYYFIIPGLMLLLGRRYWFIGIAAGFFVSISLCFLLAGRDMTFYLLPTRAWELLIGSMGIFIPLNTKRELFLKILFWPALIVLVGSPFIKIGNFHPGIEAVLICIATIIVIKRNYAVFYNKIFRLTFANAGNISYSLYLVHWPIFAFLNNIWINDAQVDPPLYLSLAAVLISLVLAYLLTRFVEDPLRHLDIKYARKFIYITIIISFILLTLTLAPIYFTLSQDVQAETNRPNYGLNSNCVYSKSYAVRSECQTADKPEILFWGDSFAMHLLPGVAALQPKPSVAQATSANCGPLLNLAIIQEEHGRNRSWAQDCISFNKSVLSYLQNENTPKTIVLASPFDYYLRENAILLKYNDITQEYTVITATQAELVAAMKTSIAELRKLGKNIVIVAPPPFSGFDIGRCLERIHNGLPTLGIDSDCEVNVNRYHQNLANVLQYLDIVSDKMNVNIIRFDDYLCDPIHCKTYINTTPIYRDTGHFSYEGSILIAKETNLLDKIKNLAK